MARHNRKHAARKAASPAGQAALVRKIRAILHEAGTLSQAELGRKCHSRRCKADYEAALQQLIRDGELLLRRHDYILTENSFRAEVVRLHAGFGFIRDEGGTDYFVPGRAFCGAMPGDKVLARIMPSQSDSPEAEVLRITEENPACRLSGMVLDGEDRLVTEPGQPGELCVRGTPLSVGYYNNPERTAAAFVQNPLQTAYEEKIYCTGDIVKYNERHELVYLSRKDFQIKHLGHRIELGEIETAAASLEGVSLCCCLYDEKHNRIVLFVEGEFDKDWITDSLKKLIPDYMVPGKIVCEGTLPLNANGKIDRVRLKEEYLG